MDDTVYLAYDYPVLGAFWTVMWIFLWVVWLVLLFRVFVDIFRDHEMSGWAKAAWLIFMLLIPFLGVLVYVIVRGKDMGKREITHAQEQQEAFNAYIRQTAKGAGPGDELARLSELKAKGDLSEEEFQRAKDKLLS
ncbi:MULTISPECIES: SHOCT domain-containing protein [Streptomyces]|uniref:SHOCT domain-containing protein n=1 Tax=Streptomyces marianii TaxID=1817406 RepID=A0A5R9DZV7_9ACTN|nr:MULTISPECIES: SHOCT domain-containing protein [Streptomyces]MDI9885486.1 SHOCT domain-containing protein [Streptomyces sp. HNM0645]TLQ42262.1 SHOCT domain-containing protein [Streptomyces marianii]